MIPRHVVCGLTAEEYDLHELCCNIAEDLDHGYIHGWRLEQVKAHIRAGGTTALDEDGELVLVRAVPDEARGAEAHRPLR
jgi:hypothetical protein